MTPMNAWMLNGVPVTSSDPTMPMPASGIESRMMNGSRSDSNCAAITA